MEPPKYFLLLGILEPPAALVQSSTEIFQRAVTPIHTILTAKAEVKKCLTSILLLDCLTALQNGF